MMRFNKRGFTLVEAMLAITMIGMILGPLFLLQATAFDGVIRVTEQFKRYLFAQNFYYQAMQKQPTGAREFSLDQKKEPPQTTMQYRLKKVTSGTLKRFNNLYMQEVTIKAADKKIPQDTLRMYVFKPQRKHND